MASSALPQFSASTALVNRMAQASFSVAVSAFLCFCLKYALAAANEFEYFDFQRLEHELSATSSGTNELKEVA